MHSATKKDSELRHLFNNFVDDCLRIAFHPDWPMAPVLLVKLLPALVRGLLEGIPYLIVLLACKRSHGIVALFRS
jgi:hypothetical protein